MDKPTRCIDPVIKFCQECPWGWTHYPEWVETADDLNWCRIESGCTLGFDHGRPEDEPTEDELKEFDKWCSGLYRPVKYGYCPICDADIYVCTDDNMCNCQICGHHINLHEEEE